MLAPCAHGRPLALPLAPAGLNALLKGLKSSPRWSVTWLRAETEEGPARTQLHFWQRC